MLSMEIMDLAIRILQILIVPAAVWVWRSVARLDAEIAALRTRLSVAEGEIAKVPTAGALHELNLSVERMSGNVKALGERLSGVDRVVERMDRMLSRQENYLLNGGPRT